MSVRSLFGGMVNESPVPLASRWGGGRGLGTLFSGRSRTAQLESQSATATLHGVTKKLANATGAVEWTLDRKPARPGDEPTPLTGGRAESAAPLRVWNNPAPDAPHINAAYFRKASQQHYDLCGEFWWVVLRFAGVPVQLWPIRPDRITPVSSETRLVAGYVYRSPDGEEIPLDVDDVICSIDPSATDPLRGSSPIGALASDLSQAAAQGEWQAAMYRNAAQPGGIIKVGRKLSDPEWDQLVERWNMQHKGVQNAGRVAVLEGESADFIPLSYTQKDMQFVESRGLTRQAIFDAYGFPKFGIGDVDDVNRASAEASMAMFSQTLIVPRLENFRTVLNTRFLPMFGSAWKNYEFNYADPTPADAEGERQDLTTKTAAYKTLIDAGVNPEDAAEVCGLPPMRIEVREEPAPEPPVPGREDEPPPGDDE